MVLVSDAVGTHAVVKDRTYRERERERGADDEKRQRKRERERGSRMWRALLVVVAALLAATEKVHGDKVVVLPHDVYPGYEVTLFNTKRPSNFRLMENNFSKFFTVLGNGLVMTTSDLSPLVDRPVNLIVVEELANATETHFLHLYVINRRNMITFSHDRLGEGEVGENRGAGTLVEVSRC